MSDGRIRSSLGRASTRSPLTDLELLDLATTAWRYRGVVIVWPEQRLGWEERTIIEQAAAKLYGERKS